VVDMGGDGNWIPGRVSEKYGTAPDIKLTWRRGRCAEGSSEAFMVRRSGVVPGQGVECALSGVTPIERKSQNSRRQASMTNCASC
jgi:hypothetical protein